MSKELGDLQRQLSSFELMVKTPCAGGYEVPQNQELDSADEIMRIFEN